MTSGADKLKVLNQRLVLERISLSPAWLKILVRQGNFPKPIKLGPKRIGWLEHEVEAWIRERAANRAAPKAPKKSRKKKAAVAELPQPQ